MRTVVWQVILLTADVDENSDVASELPRCEVVESQKSAQVPTAPLYCACIVGRGREDPTVTVTMEVVSLDGCSFNTVGEGNILTIVLSDNNTTCKSCFHGFHSHGMCDGTRRHERIL